MTNLSAREDAQPTAVQFIPAPLFTGNTFTDDAGKGHRLDEAIVVMVAASDGDAVAAGPPGAPVLSPGQPGHTSGAAMNGSGGQSTRLERTDLPGSHRHDTGAHGAIDPAERRIRRNASLGPALRPVTGPTTPAPSMS